MKTRIRDSYVPKLGDYCNTLVIDKETNNQYLFDADGVWTLISTDEEGIVVEAVAQANAYTDDVAEGKVDKEEGKGLSENDFTNGYKDKLDGIDGGAQVNVIEVVKRNGVALPITDKAVDVAVPTTTSSLINDSGYITNEVNDLVNYYDKDETDTLIATEAETRDAADLELQGQIDAISSASDVVDVVGTYAELQNYDTSKLSDNDIIKVLTDETHDDAISYYRWSDTTNAFTYIGSQGPFYTKSETDATFVPQTRTINGKGLNSDVVLTAADVNALPASTVIPTVNDATLTIQKNGTTVTTFTANSAQNATANISVPTDTSDLTNGAGYITSAAVPTNVSDLVNDAGYITSSDYATNVTSGTIKVTGAFGLDMSNSGELKGAVVSTSDYPSMWNDAVVSKGTLENVLSAKNYATQSDIPTVNDATLTIQKNGTDVATFTANSATNQTANITVPTDTSDLTNGAGFITSAAVPTKTSDLTNDSGFITNQVNNLANYYDQTAINSMFNALSVPTKTSDLTNDSGFLTTSTLPTATDSSLGVVKIGSGINVAADGTISAAVASLDWSNITNKPTDVSYWTNDAGYITSADLPTKTSDLTNDSNFVSNTSYATSSTGGVVKVGSGLSITNGILSATGGGVADAVEWDNVLNKPSFSTVATSGSYNDLSNKPTIPTVNNATLTIQRNNTSVGTFTANASSNKTINITVPTTTSDLTNDSGFIDEISTITNARIDEIMGVA